MQALLLFFFVFSVAAASGLVVVHYRRVNRELAGELCRYAQLEAQLRDSEERYRTLFELAPVGCVVWEPGFRVTGWNDQAERIFGWMKEEILGRSLYVAVLGEKGVKARRDMVSLFADGMPNHTVIPMVTKDGRTITCEWRNAVLRTPDGRPAKIISVFTDITRKKAQERELAMFRTLVELTEDPMVGIVAPREGGRFVYVNDACCRHYGMSREELLATAPSAMDPHFDAAQRASLVNTIAEKKTVRFETEHYTASGELVPVEVLLNWFEHDGEAFVAHYVRDIRERRVLEGQKILYEAAAARRESEQRLVQYASSAPGLMFTSCFAPDGKVAMPYASPAIWDLFGLGPEDVAESLSPIQALIYPDDRALVAGTIEKSARTLSFCNVEFRVAHPEKGEIWVEARSMPECRPDGSIVWNGFMIDVTTRKQAEARLRAREHEFRTLVEHSPDVVVRYGLDCRRLYVNPAWERVNGLPAEDALGKSPEERAVAVAPFASEYQEKLLAVIDSGQPADIDLSWLDDEGLPVFYAMRAVPEFDAEGRVASVLTVARDVTERRRMVAELAAREREFRVLAETLPDNLIHYDRQCRMIYMNPAMARTFSLVDAEAYQGKTPLETFPDMEVIRVYEEVLRRVLEQGGHEALEIPFPGPDGEIHIYHIRFAPTLGKGEEITGALAIGTDITERQKYEAELSRRANLERQLSAVAASVPGFIFTIRVDLDGHTSVPFASPGVEELFGLHPADIRADAALLRACYHEDDLPRVLELLEETNRTLAPLLVEVRANHPTRGQRWIEIRSTPQRQPDGATEWHGMMLDITARKHTEALLKKREAEFRALIENAPDPIYRYDRDCRRVYVNPAVERISGIPASVLLGKTPTESRLVPSEESVRVLHSIQRVLETGQPNDIEVKFVAPDGREFYFQNRHAPEFGLDGTVESVLSIGRDITERRQYEAVWLEKAELEAKLSKLAATAPGVVTIFSLASDGGVSMPYAAPGILDIYGLLPEKLAQDAGAIVGRIHPDDLPRFRESLADSARTLAPWQCEYRVHNPQRGELWVEGRAMPELGPDGDTFWYGFVHDITSRKRAQRQFEMVNFALDNVDEAAFLVEGIWIVHANMGACRSLGYSVEELKGMTVFDFTPDFGEALLDAVMDGLAEKGRYVFETRHKNKEGSVFPVEVSATRFGYEGREMRLFLARDVTERKRVEALLRAREQEFRVLVENSPDTIARYDRECRRVYANPSLEKCLGVQNARGKTPSENQAYSASATYYQEGIREVLETGKESELSLNWQAAEGTELWFHIRLVPEFGPEGEVVSVLAMGHDITELVEAEQRLKESRALLRKLTRRRESEYEKERKRVAWEVYDTLGQLLMVQRMDVSLLRARFPGETAPLSQHLDKMLGTTDKAIQVTRNVAYALRPVTLDMGVVFALEWLVGEFRKKTGIPCDLLVSEEEIHLDETNATLLFRIVEESLDNITRHAGAGCVEIELSRQGDEYLLIVRDDGKGFDLDTPMEKSMGLLGIQERVHALGGEMVLLSMPGEGTSVEVRVPIQEISDGQLDLWEES